ncbi:UpxY family transcription antiterminator [Ilyomonas limi]|uniref:UpxY family transcription antiterminator n=1 Tax=Ilyomonas limi TaxID=2575867 RepID=A0A4U3KQX9_9BACT|nr:UpxY family transcription antiterminator [Ilyomonas limi]TKK64632.1 UpxY family transcription antiterminator [Ilyomonas limi]
MLNTKKWYALYTRPKFEKKVAELLTKKNIINYCPVRKVSKQWADRKKIIHEPLFTSYVFVFISAKEYFLTLETQGVLNFVHWLGKPAVIKNEEIEVIKHFLAEYQYVSVIKNIQSNDKVRILNGPLTALEGEVVEVKNKTVKVLLPSLGYHLLAEVEKENIEILKAV